MSNKNLRFFPFKHHIGGGQQQKYGPNPLVPSCTFFVQIYSFLLMSNKNLSFFSIQTSHREWSTAQKYGQNLLVTSCTFFVQIYSIPLMSNKYLSFSNAGHKTSRRLVLCPSGFIIFCQLKNWCNYQDISFKHHIGSGQQHKNRGKIL